MLERKNYFGSHTLFQTCGNGHGEIILQGVEPAIAAGCI